MTLLACVFSLGGNSSPPYREGPGVGLFPLNGLLLIGDKEVDIVKTLDKAMLLVGVDVEVFAVASSVVGDGLLGKVDSDRSLRIGLDAGEELLQERLAHLYGQHEVI